MSYSIVAYIERLLATHERVQSFTRRDELFFEIRRKDNLSRMNVVLVNLYVVGLADVYRIQAEFPGVDCIVTGGNWNGYTKEAKDYAVASKLGLFVTGEFAGALWWTIPHKYVKKDDDGNPTYHYKSA